MRLGVGRSAYEYRHRWVALRTIAPVRAADRKAARPASWITKAAQARLPQGYDGFDPKIARSRRPSSSRLLADPGIIRHKGKIDASVSNAKAYLALVEREGSFLEVLWSFVGGKPKKNRPRASRTFPVARGDAMSKAAKAGFKSSVPPSARLQQARAWSTQMWAAIATRPERDERLISASAPRPTSSCPSDGRAPREEHGVWRATPPGTSRQSHRALLRWRKAPRRAWT